MGLEHEQVVRSHGRPQPRGIEVADGPLAGTSAAEGRGIDDDAPALEGGVGRDDPATCGRERRRVREEVRARRPERQDALDRRPERRGPRFPRALRGTHHEVVVVMQERPLGLVQASPRCPRRTA